MRSETQNRDYGYDNELFDSSSRRSQSFPKVHMAMKCCYTNVSYITEGKIDS